MGFRSGLWLGHSTTSISSFWAIPWWIYLYLWDHYPVGRSTSSALTFLTDGQTFCSSTLWYEREFIVDSVIASYPGPEAAKQPQTIRLPPPCFTVGMRFFWSRAVFGVCQTWLLVLWPNNSVFDSSVYCTLFQNSWYLPRYSLSYFSVALMFFLDSKGFLFCAVSF